MPPRTLKKNTTPKVDLSIQYISEYFRTSQEVVFFSIQILLFMFLGILLFIILRKKIIPLSLILLLNIILLYELSHVYEAVKIGGYYPGLITGVILAIIGLFLLYTLFKKALL